MGGEAILRPGENCWRIERASRVAFLIDGQAYFRALRAAMREARQSILILSWDIDTRLRLSPGEDDGLPEALGDFLHALVRRRRSLRVHALNWDWAMLYALERQWLPVYRLELERHRRLNLHFDDHHPFGASQHQKVVVIDDALAFSGGFDPTHSRWDTSEHLPDDPRRTDPNGSRYRPFHDVQMMVDGPAARALVCRQASSVPPSSGHSSISSQLPASSASIRLRARSTWVAASPIPGAAYIVSAMSAASRRISSSTLAIGAARVCRRGSG